MNGTFSCYNNQHNRRLHLFSEHNLLFAACQLPSIYTWNQKNYIYFEGAKYGTFRWSWLVGGYINVPLICAGKRGGKINDRNQNQEKWKDNKLGVQTREKQKLSNKKKKNDVNNNNDKRKKIITHKNIYVYIIIKIIIFNYLSI